MIEDLGQRREKMTPVLISNVGIMRAVKLIYELAFNTLHQCSP